MWIAITLVFCLFNLEAKASITAIAMPDDDYTDYYKKPTTSKGYLSASHYNYRKLARRIVKGCRTDYQKIKAIYQWICSNIDNDMTYSIHTADSCIDAQKGTCQAYCELFYRMASSLRLDVEIVFGKSKRPDGAVGSDGHAWIFAYTRKNHGILMDPTWGAGSVSGGAFHRSKDCWLWFNVNPEWMALTHFPDDAAYQLISQPLSMQEFAALPPVNNIWLKYGLNIHDVFTNAQKHSLSMPEIFTRGEGIVEMVEMPLQESLKIGKFYTFCIKLKQDADFSFIVDNEAVGMKKEWKNAGDGIYSIDFMPRATGDLRFCLNSLDDNDVWNTIVKYHIDPPTQEDWAQIEAYYPLSLPEVQNVGNLEAEEWERAGMDGHKLLTLIRENDVKELPPLHSSNGQKLEIVEVPMTKKISRNTTYTFRFYPKSGVKWVMKNEDEWLTDWEVSDDGMYSMTVTPVKAGNLSLYVQLEEGQSYWATLEYDVE